MAQEKPLYQIKEMSPGVGNTRRIFVMQEPKDENSVYFSFDKKSRICSHVTDKAGFLNRFQNSKKITLCDHSDCSAEHDHKFSIDANFEDLNKDIRYQYTKKLLNKGFEAIIDAVVAGLTDGMSIARAIKSSARAVPRNGYGYYQSFDKRIRIPSEDPNEQITLYENPDLPDQPTGSKPKPIIYTEAEIAILEYLHFSSFAIDYITRNLGLLISSNRDNGRVLFSFLYNITKAASIFNFFEKSAKKPSNRGKEEEDADDDDMKMDIAATNAKFTTVEEHARAAIHRMMLQLYRLYALVLESNSNDRSSFVINNSKLLGISRIQTHYVTTLPIEYLIASIYNLFKTFAGAKEHDVGYGFAGILRASFAIPEIRVYDWENLYLPDPFYTPYYQGTLFVEPSVLFTIITHYDQMIEKNPSIEAGSFFSERENCIWLLDLFFMFENNFPITVLKPKDLVLQLRWFYTAETKKLIAALMIKCLRTVKKNREVDSTFTYTKKYGSDEVYFKLKSLFSLTSYMRNQYAREHFGLPENIINALGVSVESDYVTIPLEQFGVNLKINPSVIEKEEANEEEISQTQKKKKINTKPRK